MEKESIKEITRLGQVAKINETLIGMQGPEVIPNIIIPDGWHVHNLEHSQATPSRSKFAMRTNSLKAFCELVARFKVAASTVIFSDKAGAYKAIFDFHTGGVPGWCQQTLDYDPGFHPDFELIQSWFYQWKTQFEVADLANDNIDLFANPTGADLREMALSLEGSKTELFASAKKMRDGTIRCSRSENIDLKSTKGDDGVVELPAVIGFKCPVFRGSEPIEIHSDLRLQVSKGEVKFRFHKSDRDVNQIIEAESDLINTSIKGTTGCPVIEASLLTN